MSWQQTGADDDQIEPHRRSGEPPAAGERLRRGGNAALALRTQRISAGVKSCTRLNLCEDENRPDFQAAMSTSP